MIRRAVLVAFAFALGVAARAAELAPGLVYLPASAAAETSVALAGSSVVLDLRNPPPGAPHAGLRSLRVPKDRLLLVLVSAGSKTAVPAGALRIGRVHDDQQADIRVNTTAEAETRALKALAAGADPATLVAGIAGKPRFDERSLVREHEAGTSPEKHGTQDTDDPPAADAPAKPADSPVVDAVLQRAVHVYKGLRALGKI